MRLNPDGSVHLEEGERVPFMCPGCGWVWQCVFDTSGLIADSIVQCPTCLNTFRYSEFPSLEFKD